MLQVEYFKQSPKQTDAFFKLQLLFEPHGKYIFVRVQLNFKSSSRTKDWALIKQTFNMLSGKIQSNT